MNDLKSPRIVASFAHEMEAGMLINELKQHQIDARAMGAAVAGFRAEVPGEIDVAVPAEHYDEAKRLALAMQADQAKVDWSTVDVGESTDACNDNEPTVRTLTSTAGMNSYLIIFGLFVMIMIFLIQAFLM